MDIEYLADYTQEEKKEWVSQLILTLMDYTEQSDDETFWCDLYDKYKSLKEKHVIIDQQRSILISWQRRGWFLQMLTLEAQYVPLQGFV